MLEELDFIVLSDFVSQNNLRFTTGEGSQLHAYVESCWFMFYLYSWIESSS